MDSFREALLLKPNLVLLLTTLLIPCARLLGLTESFFDEIKTLPVEDGAPEQFAGFDKVRNGERRHKKQKVRLYLCHPVSWRRLSSLYIELIIDRE